MNKRKFRILSLLIITFASCTESYTPNVLQQDHKYLVVDGFLNGQQGSATVKLTRTLPLYSEEAAPLESGATVSIEANDGALFVLPESSEGSYEKTGLPVELNKQYRLRIRTADNQEYYSDFVYLKETPPIDSVFWEPGPEGLNIYINTHDDTGNTKFYKWTFVQTWEHHAVFTSFLKLENGVVVPRPQSESIDRCWTVDNSEKIMLATSKHHNNDIINHYPLVYLERGTQQLSQKYSLLVTQQAITEEAYEYWLQLQQITESLGGLFDSMPYQLKGNIQNVTNPQQPVFGFFSGGTLQEQRIFIDVRDLPDYLRDFTPSSCPYDTIGYDEIQNQLLITEIFQTGYATSEDQCIDCRLSGGTTTKPPYWD